MWRCVGPNFIRAIFSDLERLLNISGLQEISQIGALLSDKTLTDRHTLWRQQCTFLLLKLTSYNFHCSIPEPIFYNYYYIHTATRLLPTAINSLTFYTAHTTVSHFPFFFAFSTLIMKSCTRSRTSLLAIYCVQKENHSMLMVMLLVLGYVCQPARALSRPGKVAGTQTRPCTEKFPLFSAEIFAPVQLRLKIVGNFFFLRNGFFHTNVFC